MATIVVGVDGSVEGDQALRWAYEEARLRGADLHVVHAWIYPYVGPRAGAHEAYDDMKAEAGRTLESVVDRVVSSLPPGVNVEPVLVEGSPAGELLREGKEALMIVVGSRGRGGFASLLLGSTSQQVAHHASCPVVIFRHPHG
jgi:nucleotide-binding universal stress UspA family protein